MCAGRARAREPSRRGGPHRAQGASDSIGGILSGGGPSANQGTGRMDVGMPGENLIVISGSLSSASQTTYEFDPAAGNGGFIVASFDAALAAALKRSAYRSVRRTCSAGRVAVRRTRHA